MPFSDTYSNNILNWAIGRSSSLTAHSKVYIGLCENDPEEEGKEGTFNELSGNGYARVLIHQYNQEYPGLMGTASSRKVKNTKQIAFNKATGNWAQVKGFGLFTAEQGGTPFYYAKLKNPVDTANGAVFLFDPEMLQIGFQKTDVEMPE